MEKTMFDYISESCELVKENTLNAKSLTREAVLKYCSKKFERIIIVASGSSYNG